jgi:replication factor A1
LSGHIQERVKPASKQFTFLRQFLATYIKRGENLNQKKPTIMEDLAFLSVKEGIYFAELYQAMVEAREKGKTTCQSLTVEYRGSVKKESIFLITKETRVIVQFRLDEELLLRKNICFESWMSTDKIRKQMNRQRTSSKMSIMIQDLRHGMKKVNIEAKVLETPQCATVQTRYGNSAKVTNALVADETGQIKLCLWNEQADFVNVGDTVQIKNASVSTFKGERQLRLGKNGTVSILQNRPNEAKQAPEDFVKNKILA